MSDSANQHLIAVGGGRELDVREWGDPAGSPVFFLHGTPGGALLRHVDVDTGADLYAARQLRVLTYARPGYGRSTPRPGRRVVDDVDDVAAVADALGIERFGVTGVSGGGPAALAVAARLPDRVRAVAVVAGLVPFGAAGLDYFEGMDDDGRRWYADLTGPDQDLVLAREWQETQEWIRDELPRSDLAPGLREMLVSSAEEAMRGGPSGMRDDYLAFVSDWGFDVGDVRVPVRLLYAEDDTDIPPGHARWLHDRLPGSELTWISGDHMGGGVEQERSDRELDLLAWAATVPR